MRLRRWLAGAAALLGGLAPFAPASAIDVAQLARIVADEEDHVSAVELVPSPVSGTFQVRVGERVLWDRKADAGFPQAAELKRRVRDVVAPGRPLGHSEAKA